MTEPAHAPAPAAHAESHSSGGGSKKGSNWFSKLPWWKQVLVVIAALWIGPPIIRWLVPVIIGNIACSIRGDDVCAAVQMHSTPMYQPAPPYGAPAPIYQAAPGVSSGSRMTVPATPQDVVITEHHTGKPGEYRCDFATRAPTGGPGTGNAWCADEVAGQ